MGLVNDNLTKEKKVKDDTEIKQVMTKDSLKTFKKNMDEAIKGMNDVLVNFNTSHAPNGNKTNENDKGSKMTGDKNMDPMEMMMMMDMDPDKMDPMAMMMNQMLSENKDINPMQYMMMNRMLSENKDINPMQYMMMMNQMVGNERMNPLMLMQMMKDDKDMASMMPLLLAGNQEMDPNLFMMMSMMKSNSSDSKKKDYLSVLKANLDDVSEHTVTDLLNLVKKAYDQNKERESELARLKFLTAVSVSKKLNTLLANSDGQTIVRNLLKEEQDDRSTELKLKLKEKGIDQELLLSTFECKHGICSLLDADVRKLEDNLINLQIGSELDAETNENVSSHIKDYLPKIESMIEVLENAVKCMAKEREKEEAEKIVKEEAEKREKEELNASCIEAFIKELKASGDYDKIIGHLKDNTILTADNKTE